MEQQIGFNDIFKEIDKKGSSFPLVELESFISQLEINWANKRNITKQQFQILKKSLDDIVTDSRKKILLENTIISICQNYVIANFKPNQFSNIYLEFIKDYLSCSESLKKISNIYKFLKNNKSNIISINQLPIEIINLLINLNKDKVAVVVENNKVVVQPSEEEEQVNNNNNNNNDNNNGDQINLEEIVEEMEEEKEKLLINEINLLNCILLFKDTIGIEGYQIYKEYIMELINSFYEYIIPSDDEGERFEMSIPFENLIFLIELYQDYQPRNKYLNLLLKFVYFFECIQTTPWFQIKYRNELLEAIQCEDQLFGKKESFPTIEKMVITLLDNFKFDVFKLQGLLMSINRGTWNDYLKYIFSIVEFDITIPTILNSFDINQVNPKNVIKQIIDIKKSELEMNSLSKEQQHYAIESHRESVGFFKCWKSFFKIENYYNHDSSKLEKKYLKSMYIEIFSILSSTLYLESFIEALVYKLDEFPNKLKFIKKKLSFILSQLEIPYIHKYLLPFSKELELLDNSIYKKKMEQFQHVEISEIITQLPYEIILLIFEKLIDSPSMNQYQKFEISLISRDCFNMVASIMNNSITTPIEINSQYYFHHGTGGIYSLFQHDRCTNIKFLSIPTYIEPDDQMVDSHLYSLTQVIDSFSEWNHIISFTNENKLHTLEIQGDLNFNYLDYLVNNENLKNLKLSTNSTSANELSHWINQFNSNGNGKRKIDLHLFIDVKEEEPNINYRLNFDMVESCTVEIGLFFDSDFYENCLPKIKRLTLVIEQWDKYNTASFETIPIIDLFLKKDKTQSTLQCSQLIELDLQFKTKDSNYEYFDKILNLFENASNLQFITFSNPGGGDTCSKPKIISNICKVVSKYEKIFKNLNSFSITKSSNNTMYENITDEKDWFNVNTFSFKPELNFKIFNKITNKKVRKFDEI